MNRRTPLALRALVGVVLALGAGTASAQPADINLDAAGTADDPVNNLTISLETLSNAAGQTVTVEGVTYYSLELAVQRVVGAVGVRGQAGRTIFVRFDLDNMAWDKALPATAITSNLVDLTVEAGGARGGNWVVRSMAPDLVVPPTQRVFLSLNRSLAIRPGFPGTIRMTVYVNLADALAARNPLVSKSQTTFATARSLRQVVTPRTVTATVASGFAKLAAAGSNTIGTLSIAIGGGSNGPTHYGVPDRIEIDTFAEVAQAGNVATGRGSLVTFKGDFSVGAFLSSTGATPSCGTQPLTTRDAQGNVVDKLTVPAGAGVTSLCINVPATNTAAIPHGEYTVAVDYQGLTNAAFPPEDLAETTIGRIRHDGTRVQVPFLTTYSGYSQRVIIVNRNRVPVSYAFGFTAEDGVTATPGQMAQGVVPPESRMMLRATDIVNLAGKTRTAATLNIVATPGSVDVATFQVNMADKGTDTVLFESLEN